ncbi:hypothetical protein D6D02_07885 [Aureobasidium pullulans]|nr:hypothetical protein D6D02_07885 [Aureobasidium pullulans]
MCTFNTNHSYFFNSNFNTSLLLSSIIMAILDSLPGVEITVVVDGEDLHEYQDTDMEDEENTVTKYVEAITDANFAIKIKGSQELEYKGDCLSLDVLVDGLRIQRPLIGREATRNGGYTRLVEGLKVNAGYMRRLRFNTLETGTWTHTSQQRAKSNSFILVTEHGFGLPEDLERVKTMGKIEVRLVHKIWDKPTERTYKDVANDIGIISEKAIKGQAMTHSLGYYQWLHLEANTLTLCSLDPVTPIASGICKTRVSSCKTTVSSCKPVEGVQNPAATFVFFYRSKTSLKELMIIPRTPSPVPLEDRPEEELNPEEMAELAKVAVTSQVKKEVKRELEDDDDNDSRARKRARPSAGAINFEINDDDTFTEVAVVHKEKDKEVIALD